MWQNLPKHSDKPEKAGGEGWLVNVAQKKLVQFQPIQRQPTLNGSPYGRSASTPIDHQH